MSEDILIGLASIILLGIGAQWLAWRIQIPSILFLLLLGVAAGPIFHIVNPDRLFGNLLTPVVSLSVALILFEGGLTLRISELREIGDVVRNLATTGVAVTWIVSALALWLLVGIGLPIAILLGAVFVVTGPTVIGPLLRHVRPTGRVGSAIKWEGIVNDPIGALLAVLVFEGILVGSFAEAGYLIALGLLKTIFFGTLIGAAVAALLVILIDKYWVPDYLQQTVTLMLVIAAFLLSNHIQAESGLLTVTLMGIVLANQKRIAVRHIIEFKESLSILLISSLFIILAARLKGDDLALLGTESLLFLAILLFFARPLSVVLATIGTELNWRERVFVAWMAPRGIVAAAIISIFAFRLSAAGVEDTEFMVPLTFLVIVGTVAIYGLTAVPVARWLKVSNSDPQGVLIIGAHYWARKIALTLQATGFKVLLVDTNRRDEYQARMDGLPTYHGSILSDPIHEEIELDGIGRLLSLTSNDEVNSLAALHFGEIFGRRETYQLHPPVDDSDVDYSPQHLRGRLLFGGNVYFDTLRQRFAAGAEVKATTLTKSFDFKRFLEKYGPTTIPLFLITEEGKLEIFSTDRQLQPKPEQKVIAVVPEGID